MIQLMVNIYRYNFECLSLVVFQYNYGNECLYKEVLCDIFAPLEPLESHLIEFFLQKYLNYSDQKYQSLHLFSNVSYQVYVFHIVHPTPLFFYQEKIFSNLTKNIVNQYKLSLFSIDVVPQEKEVD